MINLVEIISNRVNGNFLCKITTCTIEFSLHNYLQYADRTSDDGVGRLYELLSNMTLSHSKMKALFYQEKKCEKDN